ncbi:hypothetical protein F5B21DRAFT_516009 [Xylaria acuta]|nr:hypothetical protein F5B21DRAFT_516009 [Xylaria acuta]
MCTAFWSQRTSSPTTAVSSPASPQLNTGIIQTFIMSGSGLASDANTLNAIARDATGLSDALTASLALASSNTTLQALGAGPNLDSYVLPLVVWEHIQRQSIQIRSLRENSQRLGMEGQGRIEDLRDDVTKRLKRLSEETSKTQEDIRHLTDSLKAGAPKPMATNPTRFGLSPDLTNYFSGVIKQLAEEQSLTGLNQDFLESLYFSQIKARQRNIEPAHAKTFGWIFQHSVPDGSKTISFDQWLREGGGTFWIQGKAGSGKSTLMKFVCSHATTMKSLREWAGSKQLITAEFFFWNAGTVLQKSREGLLRSLLFEILRKCPELIPRVSKGNQRAPFRERSRYSHAADEELWSQEELMEAYRNLVTCCDEHMIDSVPAIYVPQMARTLWMATSAPEPQFLIVYSLLDDVSDDMAAFAEERPPKLMCDDEVRIRIKQMWRRLDGRCKGLLEVVADGEPNASLYFQCKVDFLHRTVRDFLLGSPEICHIVEQQRIADLSGIGRCADNVWLLPCLSIIEAFKRAPFRTKPQAPRADSRIAKRLLKSLMMFAHQAEMNMTNRSALVRMLHHAEGTYYRRRQLSWTLEKYSFLRLACHAGLFSYIENRITRDLFIKPSNLADAAAGASGPGPPVVLLSYALDPSRTLHPRIIQHLLNMGADPNARVAHKGHNSSWCIFLRGISSREHLSKDEPVREVIRLLLKHGARLDTLIDTKGERLITARELVEKILHQKTGEFQEDDMWEQSELDEESPGLREGLKRWEPEKTGSEIGSQFDISWLFSWWNR